MYGHRVWDIACFVVILINAVLIPLRIAFFGLNDSTETGELIWLVAGLLMDAFFWVNIYLHYRRFATVYDGLLISHKSEFMNLYVNGRLKFDLLGSLPVDAIVWLAGGHSFRTVAIFRLPRFFYLAQMPRLMQNFVDFLEERGLRAKAGVWHLLKMTIFVLLTVHWLACIFFYMSVYQEQRNVPSWAINIDGIGYFSSREILDGEGVTLMKRYMVSVYWSMYTITLVGYGDITLRSNSEMLLAILGMVTGAVLCDAGITAILSR